MAYITNQVSQSANTTLNWDVTSPSATVFDTVEEGITSAQNSSTSVAVVLHQVFPGPIHRLTVRVVGGAASFRARGGLQT
jgi:hypothetical protein